MKYLSAEQVVEMHAVLLERYGGEEGSHLGVLGYTEYSLPYPLNC